MTTNLPPVSPAAESNKWRNIIIGLVCGVFLLSCTCCGGLYFFFYKARESIKSGTFTESITGGRMSTTKLPTDFPTDIPVYEGAVIVLSFNKAPGSTDKVSMVTLTSTAKSQDIIDFYKSKMVEGGWTEDTITAMPTGARLSYKKDKREANIQINGTDAQATINISYLTQP